MAIGFKRAFVLFSFFIATLLTIMSLGGPASFSWATFKISRTAGFYSVDVYYYLGLDQERICMGDKTSNCDTSDFGKCEGTECDCGDAGKAAQGLLATLLTFQLILWLLMLIQGLSNCMGKPTNNIVVLGTKYMYAAVLFFGFIFGVAAIANYKSKCYDGLHNDGYGDLALGPGWGVALVALLFNIAMVVGIQDAFQSDSAGAVIESNVGGGAYA